MSVDDYPALLAERRRLMAQKNKTYFKSGSPTVCVGACDHSRSRKNGTVTT